jgi:hypothetical protein
VETTVAYTDADVDKDSQRWIGRPEIAETPFTAFTGKKSEQF